MRMYIIYMHSHTDILYIYIIYVYIQHKYVYTQHKYYISYMYAYNTNNLDFNVPFCRIFTVVGSDSGPSPALVNARTAMV